ncbi:hypothetical protein HPB48_002401 [Haemaphysalis longicornis]|uniref:Uncharacterized protein n=1 Tax=Haemaphysalis longicornis TaxID=44386 RepID=A0A9J6F9Q3_HAELO|nr:hypothetical protein HPB48_002401 [Haemaphysalis longicornis]
MSDVRDSKVDTVDAQLRSLEEWVSKKASIILRLQAELNESEQYSRSCNLEIRGLPDDPNQDLAAVIADLGHYLNINFFSPSQLIAVHRLPIGKNKPALVLVKFTSKAVRDQWLSGRSKLRSGLPDIIFADNLTRANKDFYFVHD